MKSKIRSIGQVNRFGLEYINLNNNKICLGLSKNLLGALSQNRIVESGQQSVCMYKVCLHQSQSAEHLPLLFFAHIHHNLYIAHGFKGQYFGERFAQKRILHYRL